MKHGSQQRFSIRKYSFGAASVLIANLVFMGGQVQADSLQEASVVSEVISQEISRSGSGEQDPILSSSKGNVEVQAEVATTVVSEEISIKETETVEPSSVVKEEVSTKSKLRTTFQPKSVEVKPQLESSDLFSTGRAATAGNPILASLPDAGTYVFDESTDVHVQPRLSSGVVATYQKGQSVAYDRILTEDDRLWLSYIATSGTRRYVALPAQNNAGQTTDTAVANTLNALAPQGTYTFSKTAGVKNEARIASPNVATYKPGQTVRYDRVLTADSHRWISYISYSGARRYVAIEEISQPSKPVAPAVKVEKTGKVASSNVTTQGYEIRVSQVQHPEGVKEVLVPSWSEKNGQDDIIWHKANRQADGTYKAFIPTVDHKYDSGPYQSHVYYVTNQNKREFVTKTQVSVPQAPVVQKTGQVSTSNVSSTGFDVVVKNVNHPAGVKEVLVPTWSEKNGQDDIVWHKASKQTDGSYKVHIETSQHKYDSGKYQVHVHYVTGSNQRTYVTETTVGIPQAPVVQKTGQVSTSNVSSTGFDVIVKNVNHPSGVKEVLVPTWSEKNGQDDIVWHKASKQTDGSYKVHIETSQHKYDSGKYQVHVHYVTGSNQRTYVTETTVGIPQAPVVQKTGQVSTSNVSSTGFDVVVKNVNHPAGVKEVLVPTWSEKNGQDDIVWHKASKQTDGSYKVHIETSQHKYDSGKYQVHVHYVTGSNQRTYVTETIVQIPQSQKSIHVENANDTGFDVRITNLNKFTNVREVLVPTWTSHNGQDDLIWHKASRQADGSYKARIEYSRHNYEYGMYTIHSYVKDATGQLKWLDSTSFDAPKPANVGKGYPEKWVGTKKYSGVVTHIDSNPVYSDQNRVTIDRIVIHHNAGMSDEGARATWYIRNGNETSAHYQVTPDKIWGVVPENEVAWHAGHYPTNQRSIGIEHLNNSLGPEWTIAEETYRNSAKLIADISLRYNIPLDRDHVIGHDEVSATLCPGGIDIDKLLSMAKAERTQLENVAIPKTSPAPAPQTPQKLEVPYYSQLDSRWANKRYGNYLFGPTGCVPTTLAMAFTGLSGKTVLPTEVGDYIYKNTDAFNKIGPGTAATGIAKAVSHWGYKSEVLKTKQAIQASLELGNPVLLAVGPSVFVNYPSTHELLLTEYKDGKVKLSDPYTKSLSGWHSLDYLWNVRSHNSYDNALGSPAIAVKRA